MSRLRRNIAYTCFGISSVFKAIGKFVITKEKTIVVDMLSLPGWFVVDEHITWIESPIKDSKLKGGFAWHCWGMPDKWCEHMDKLKRMA